MDVDPRQDRLADITADDEFTPDELDALRPYVVNLSLGEFSTDGIMQTSKSDVDAIFDEHLPAFLERAGRGGPPVPLVFWAHGGIVSERNGLGIACAQVCTPTSSGCCSVRSWMSRSRCAQQRWCRPSRWS